MEIDGNGFEVLPPAECLRLLATESVGRLATHAGALPVIVPVTYAVDRGSLVVRVEDCPRLYGVDGDEVVAFEVDRPPGVAAGGWSVHVVGLVTEIIDGPGFEAARALPLARWTDTGCERFVRISLDLLTGRRRCRSAA